MGSCGRVLMVRGGRLTWVQNGPLHGISPRISREGRTAGQVWAYALRQRDLKSVQSHRTHTVVAQKACQLNGGPRAESIQKRFESVVPNEPVL